jgi:hypothetical protein
MWSQAIPIHMDEVGHFSFFEDPDKLSKLISEIV